MKPIPYFEFVERHTSNSQKIIDAIVVKNSVSISNSNQYNELNSLDSVILAKNTNPGGQSPSKFPVGNQNNPTYRQSDQLENYQPKEEKEKKKLLKSMVAKSPESGYSEISINRAIKNFLKFIDPIISSTVFQKILIESKKPIKSELTGLSEVRSKDIIGPSKADEKTILGNKNPNKISMYEQGKNMDSLIVDQKHKHFNPNKPELPSSPDTVKHIVNALELIPNEGSA